ncbi:hypothetical protein B0H13DRAFT_2280536 [Mycena leptocephala]|nr:hypothetical protein B0H13DRAFT_2280536 [Mycena leptocephala]
MSGSPTRPHTKYCCRMVCMVRRRQGLDSVCHYPLSSYPDIDISPNTHPEYSIALFSCSQDLEGASSRSTMTLASMQHADRPCNYLSDPLSSGKRSPRKICIASDPYKRTSTTNLVRTWLNDIRDLGICTSSKNSSLYPGWELCGVMYRFTLAKTPSICLVDGAKLMFLNQSDTIMKPWYRTVSLPRDVAQAQGSMSLDLKIMFSDRIIFFTCPYVTIKHLYPTAFFILGWPRGFTGSE